MALRERSFVRMSAILAISCNPERAQAPSLP